MSLSKEALKVINDYLNLPIGNVKISCPYFNNRHSGVRAGLRVLIGKGNIEDILEEAMLISLREKIDLKNLNFEQAKKFLIDNNIGIDCSGLAYHILDAELQAQGKGKLKKYLKFPFVKNPLRKILTKLRPVESAGVRTFAHELNSVEVKLNEIKPGDMIVMIGTGPKHDYNHVLIVHNLEDSKIQYTHSMKYPTDGLINHGVRQGEIEIIVPEKNLLEQKWSEAQALDHAKLAEALYIRRLKIMD